MLKCVLGVPCNKFSSLNFFLCSCSVLYVPSAITSYYLGTAFTMRMENCTVNRTGQHLVCTETTTWIHSGSTTYPNRSPELIFLLSSEKETLMELLVSYSIPHIT